MMSSLALKIAVIGFGIVFLFIGGIFTIVSFAAPPGSTRGTLEVMTSPIPGQIFINGHAVGYGNVQLNETAGNYTVSFGQFSGFVAPAPVIASVAPGNITIVNATYASCSQPSVASNPECSQSGSSGTTTSTTSTTSSSNQVITTYSASCTLSCNQYQFVPVTVWLRFCTSSGCTYEPNTKVSLSYSGTVVTATTSGSGSVTFDVPAYSGSVYASCSDQICGSYQLQGNNLATVASSPISMTLTYATTTTQQQYVTLTVVAQYCGVSAQNTPINCKPLTNAAVAITFLQTHVMTNITDAAGMTTFQVPPNVGQLTAQCSASECEYFSSVAPPYSNTVNIGTSPVTITLQYATVGYLSSASIGGFVYTLIPYQYILSFGIFFIFMGLVFMVIGSIIPTSSTQNRSAAPSYRSY